MSTSQAMTPTQRVWRLVVGLIALAAILIAPTGLKYFLYERAVAAPRLRSLVGKEVTLPTDANHSRERTGTLKYVGYRPNDKWGWFDLHVNWEGKNSSGWTGLSPEAAAQVVEVVD